MDVDAIAFGRDGIVPVAIVDAADGALLTLAWANREAIERTLATRETHLYSRSRARLWRKGEESGHTQRVIDVTLDCDGDAVQYRVEPTGPACHTGERSCFHRSLLAADEGDEDPAALAHAFAHLEAVLRARKSADPATSYVAKLFAGGVDRIGKKIGEEATEVVIAAKNDDEEELVWESADLLFHLLVLLAQRNVSTARVGAQLLARARPR